MHLFAEYLKDELLLHMDELTIQQKQRLLWINGMFPSDQILSQRAYLTNDVLKAYSSSLDGLSELQNLPYLTCMDLVSLIEPGVLNDEEANAFWTVLIASIKTNANKKKFFMG